MELKNRFLPAMLLGLSMTTALGADSGAWRSWWLTPEQQGQRAFERGEYAQAATLYRDPMRAGVAWYRAGEFDKAAVAFGRVNTPEAAFNQGNALVLQGQYEAALGAYQRALEARPDWVEAEENRKIAEIRQARKQASSEQVGKATEIGADEVVFDLKSDNNENQDEIEVGTGEGMSDQELRALWLRKSQTSPAVFLKSKVAAQLAAQTQAQSGQ